MIRHPKIRSRLLARTALAAGFAATALGLAPVALAKPAAQVTFSTDTATKPGPLDSNSALQLKSGTTQVKLGGGGSLSLVGAAKISVVHPGAVRIESGSATVVAGPGAPVEVQLPKGVVARIPAGQSAASFAVAGNTVRGSVLAGEVRLTGAGAERRFGAGQFWNAASGRISQRMANQALTVTDARRSPIAQIKSGVPFTLVDPLVAAGARQDLIAAARRVEAWRQNPTYAAFPKADFTTLAAYAAPAAQAYGSPSFKGAGADIVLTYFQYLASGKAGSGFLTSYAQILVSYLDLLRAGALPSSFKSANQAQLSAYLGYISRTSGFGSLSADNQTLLNAYLAFLNSGGVPDGFATSLSNLTGAYLDFVRAGNDPATFTRLGQATLLQYLTIVQSGGIKAQLTAQNQAFVDAYIASLKASGNGLAFLTIQGNALAAFLAHIKAGGLPSAYTTVDAATLQAYLAQLSAAGLLDLRLGSDSAFAKAYLTYLQSGGAADQFAQLPINIWTNEATALTAYYTYLLNGGLPSNSTTLTPGQVQAYLADLRASGRFDAFLGSNAAFYSAFLTYLAGGGSADAYPALPNIDFAAYASAVSSYLAYIRAGNLPSAYTGLTQAQLQAYLTALSLSGRLNSLLANDSAYLTALLAYLQSGGVPDQYTQLPINVWTSYAAALNAYYAFLAGGGRPSAYTVLSQADILAYLNALQASGQFTTLIGSNASFFTAYLTYISGGGAPDAYTSLPVTSGGSGGGTGGNTGNIITGYQGGFPKTGSTGFYTSAGATGGFGGGFFANFKPSLNADGTVVQTGTAKATEVAGDALGVIGRYSGGTFAGPQGLGTISANAGVSYVYMAQVSGSLPTNDTIVNYDLLAATKPVYSDGHTAPGSITASLAFKFGSSLTYKMSGTVTMADATYTFASPGAAQGSFSAPQTAGQLDFIVLRPVLSASGQACQSSSCILNFYGGFGGSTPQNRIGLAYLSFETGRTSTAYLDGAVLFGAPGTYAASAGSSSTGTTTTPGTTTGTLGFSTANVTVNAGPISSTTALSQRVNSGVNNPTLQAKYDLVANTDGTATNTYFYAIGTARNVENGSIGSLVGWSRWTNGTVTDNVRGTSLALGSNQGIAHIWGEQATNLPTTGTANYTMAGSTSPVVLDGSVAPGTLNSASLAVNFATSHVDFGANLTIGGKSVTIVSPQSNSTLNNGVFFGATTATGYSGGASQSSYNGFLAGNGGTAAGLGYIITDSALPSITGTVAFRKGP